jgi:hypothetical protein
MLLVVPPTTVMGSGIQQLVIVEEINALIVDGILVYHATS